MNIPVPLANVIEWPRPNYEFQRTYCKGINSNDHTDHLNTCAELGWELIHIHADRESFAWYYWRKLKVLGVPIE